LIRNSSNVIYELSLLPDAMIVLCLDKDVDLISKDRHKYEKKDSVIRNLIGNEETVRFEITKVSNPLL
jgi:hypothetical protein